MSQSTRFIQLFGLFCAFHTAAWAELWGLDFTPSYMAEFRGGAVAMRPVANYKLPDGVTRWAPGAGVGLKLFVGSFLGAEADYAFIYRSIKINEASVDRVAPSSFFTFNVPVRVSWSARDYVAPLVGMTYESFSSSGSSKITENAEWLASQFRIHSGVQLKTHLLGISFILEGAMAMYSLPTFEGASKGVQGFTSSYWFAQTDFPVYKIDDVESYLSLRYGNAYRTHIRSNQKVASREESGFLISGTKY